MKKIFAMAVAAIGLLLMSLSAKAQDIILTTDAQIIRANVEEISDDSIAYKPIDNQNGPLYRISVSRVSKIMFSNGTEKVFTPAQPVNQPRPNADATKAVASKTAVAKSDSVLFLGRKFKNTVINVVELGQGKMSKQDGGKFVWSVLTVSNWYSDKGYLFSVSTGINERGGKWIYDYDGDIKQTLSANALYISPGAGYSFPFNDKGMRLDLVAGIHFSYDLWGSMRTGNNNSVSLGNITNHNRFDFGYDLNARFYFSDIFMLSLCMRNGFLDTTTDKQGLFPRQLMFGIGYYLF